MANKNPRLENLKPFKPKGNKSLSKPVSCRLDQEDYEFLMSFPKEERGNLLRQFIKNGLEELKEENSSDSLVYG